jgi:Putative MetA-pathway of phenol degradation
MARRIFRAHYTFLGLGYGFALLLALTIAPALSRGQCRDTDFPSREGIAAAPSRPVESSSPDPIGVGVYEIETGFTRGWGSGGVSQYALTNLGKLGAWCNVEVRWSANSFLRNASDAANNSGFGDNYLTAQYRFHRESAKLPSVAFAYMEKFPSADAGLGLGSGFHDHMYMLLFGKTVGKVAIITNANYFVIGTGSHHHDEKAEFTLEASRPLRGKWSAIGEVYYDSHLNGTNAAFGNSTWALSYTMNPRLVFDGGAYVALSTGTSAPPNAIFFGVSYAPGALYGRPRAPRKVAEE